MNFRSKPFAATAFAFVCVLAAAMAAPATARKPAGSDAKTAARIDAFLAPLFDDAAPGATVIVTRDGKTIFRKAYGVADVETGRPMRPDDVMRLASVTKQFTATAIMLLVEDGKLRLDEDFTVYLPDYPKPAQTITVDQLLTHTSGIPGYTELPGFGIAVGMDVTPAQMIERFNRLPLQFAPGTQIRYNNSAYFLLGAIIERVSGKSYADFMAERVFEPLGMRDTAYEGRERHGKTRVQGHRQIAREGRPAFAPALPISMTQPYSAGALVSTVDDLARWDAAIASGRLLKPESWRLLHTAIPLQTGNAGRVARGWFLSELQGREIVHHNGGIPGFNTDALRVPSERLYSAVLINAESGRPSATALNRHIAAIAMGTPLGFNPGDKPFYLRGSMNAWGTSTPMQRVDADTYRAEIALARGEYEFKIGSEDWGTVDFGASGEARTALDTPVELTMVGGNLTFAAAEAGTYRFTLEVANPLLPTLRIER
jgi:CubicO group peptidase (beta-lactamase class C family)